MKILPIQSFSNYSDSKQISINKNLQTVKTQCNNINFNGIFDVFKSSEKKFYSKQEVLEKLKEIEGINYLGTLTKIKNEKILRFATTWMKQRNF